MTELYVDVVGEGPIPLVILHGWAMHGGVTAAMAAALALGSNGIAQSRE